MNALSLWQPWASLIAFGYKKIETRSWHPGTSLEGEPIAIHAAAKPIGYDYFNHAERKFLDLVLQ